MGLQLQHSLYHHLIMKHSRNSSLSMAALRWPQTTPFSRQILLLQALQMTTVGLRADKMSFT
jgi:hypothetical protein